MQTLLNMIGNYKNDDNSFFQISSDSTEENRKTLIIAEMGTLENAYHFYTTCKSNMIRPLFGIRTYVHIAKDTGYNMDVFIELILIAKNKKGFLDCICINEKSCSGYNSFFPNLKITELSKYGENLIAILPITKGMFAYFTGKGMNNYKESCIKKLKGIFTSDLFAGIDSIDTLDKNNMIDELPSVIIRDISLEDNPDMNEFPEGVVSGQIIYDMCREEDHFFTIPPYSVKKQYSDGNIEKYFLQERLNKRNSSNVDSEIAFIKEEKVEPYIIMLGELAAFARKENFTLVCTGGSGTASPVLYGMGITDISHTIQDAHYAMWYHGTGSLTIDLAIPPGIGIRIISYLKEQFPDWVIFHPFSDDKNTIAYRENEIVLIPEEYAVYIPFQNTRNDIRFPLYESRHFLDIPQFHIRFYQSPLVAVHHILDSMKCSLNISTINTDGIHLKDIPLPLLQDIYSLIPEIEHPEKLFSEYRDFTLDELSFILAVYELQLRHHIDWLASISRIMRFRGHEYLHLKKYFKDTNGYLIFREQVLSILCKVGGFSPREANQARKYMNARRTDKISTIREQFIEGAAKKTIPRKKAESIFSELSALSVYTLSKCHYMTTAYYVTALFYRAIHYPDAVGTVIEMFNNGHALERDIPRNTV